MPTRERILAAASQIAAQGGASAVSMRGVGERVGVTPMAIYRHFASKEALLDELSRRAFAKWEARLGRIASREPLAWLRRASTEFLDFALDDPHAFEIAFLTRLHSSRRYPDDFEAGRSPAVTMVAERVAACVRAGTFRDVPPYEAGLAFWAHGQGLVSLYRAGRFAGGEKEFRRAYVRSMEIVFAGLLARGKR